METKILMAYASKYGSTQEVAEVIAATLSASGLRVDFQPMRRVHTLTGYGAIVLGAPLYFGLWHKDALNFLLRNEDALAQRPVAIFALGPNSNDEKEMQGSRAQLDTALTKFSWLTPVVIEVFGGKYPAKLHFPESLIASLPASPLHGMQASDVRDWTAIRTWANSLVQKLQPVISR
jgi:menaquinone-dependent protoporphyrinogen oxidase